ncbi:MAG TPA: hypothetical protein EYP14_15515, partial [Planctomycetaceae bacterium]|nr:hypothetical protein [Planctomycetaceae bacterium]
MDDFNEFVGTEFSRLLLRGSDLDWARLALELAADGQPQLDPGRTLRWISERRDELLGVVAAAWSESDALRRLAACLVERHGIEGHSSAVRSADGYYLNRIIETGRGAPIGLSLLYLAVARSLMMELHPVAAPIRFLTRYESTEGPTFVDPYDRGRLMSFDECIGWCAEFGDRDELGRRLEPVSPRVAILHMLNRLKILHVEREDWQTAWRVQRRLAA